MANNKICKLFGKQSSQMQISFNGNIRFLKIILNYLIIMCITMSITQ